MATRKINDLCIVTVGFTHLLLPGADGLKVLALLRNACEVERDWESGHREVFIAGERPRCELQMVSPKDVRAKVEDSAPRGKRKPLLLGHDG